MSVTRDKLYEEVWAEPKAKVAVRDRISASYLARVCDYLNVSYPHRGYWPSGRSGRRQPVCRYLPRVRVSSGTSGRPASRSERPARHQLLRGVRESFAKARFSEVGHAEAAVVRGRELLRRGGV